LTLLAQFEETQKCLCITESLGLPTFGCWLDRRRVLRKVTGSDMSRRWINRNKPLWYLIGRQQTFTGSMATLLLRECVAMVYEAGTAATTQTEPETAEHGDANHCHSADYRTHECKLEYQLLVGTMPQALARRLVNLQDTGVRIAKTSTNQLIFAIIMNSTNPSIVDRTEMAIRIRAIRVKA
jgi:hypothetical protein